MTTKYSYSEKEILGATGNIYKGTANGKSAWSNKEIIEIGVDNPFKLTIPLVWSERKPNFQELIDRRVKGQSEVAILKTEKLSIPKPLTLTFPNGEDSPVDVYKCHKLIGAGDFTAVIQDKYCNFFKARYPRCRFCVAKIDPSISPVSVYNKAGELVGLIMPMFV